MLINSTIKNKCTKDNFIKFNFVKLLHLIFAIVVVAWMNNGIFTYLIPYHSSVYRYLIYAMWFVLAIFLNKNFFKIFMCQTKFLILFIIYIIILSFFVKTDLIIQIKSISYLVIVYSIFIFYINNKNLVYIKYLCYFLIFDWLFLGLNTYAYLQKNPLVARYLSTGTITKKKLLGENNFAGIGSYGYFYSLVSLIIMLTFNFLYKNNKKIAILLLLIMSFIILIKAAFTIAILFSVLFIIIIIIFKYFYINKQIFISSMAIGIISLFLFGPMFSSLCLLVSDINGIPIEVSVRLIELANFLSGENIFKTDLNARFTLYSDSIRVFSDNMLFGAAINPQKIKLIGGHSAWFDLLGTFGLPSLLFFFFLFDAYKYCRKKIHHSYQLLVKLYWFYFICLGFVNTLLFAPIYTVWFLFLPLYLFDKKLTKMSKLL